MNSLFGKITMTIGVLAACMSLIFWNTYKGRLALDIFSTMTPDQAFGFTKLFAAFAFITLLVLFVMFLGRDRSKD